MSYSLEQLTGGLFTLVAALVVALPLDIVFGTATAVTVMPLVIGLSALIYARSQKEKEVGEYRYYFSLGTFGVIIGLANLCFRVYFFGIVAG